MFSKLNKIAMASAGKVDTQQVGYNCTNEEKKVIADLRKLYEENFKLDVEVMCWSFNGFRIFEPKYNTIYDNRRKIIEDFKKNNCGGANPNEPNVINFWLNVLKVSYRQMITQNDEKILTHLIDIRSKVYNESDMKFVIEFHFEPNDHFTDSVLTKTYYIHASNTVIKIGNCEGCHINWKNQSERDTIKGEDQTSFFDFFSPPELPEDPEDDTYENINVLLLNDYKMGMHINYKVIPKAVVYFVQEVADHKRKMLINQMALKKKNFTL